MYKSSKFKDILLVSMLVISATSPISGAEDKNKDPIELEVLATAKTFDDGITDPAKKQSQRYSAFQRFLCGEASISISKLQNRQKKATPAGKLYIAALIRELDSRAGIPALMQLYNEQTRVKYVSGNESAEYSVAEIAKQLLKEGQFHQFRLRARCKT